MSIRLKVTLATVAIAALAVLAVDVTTFVLMSGYLNKRANANVREVAQKAVQTLRSGHRLTVDAA